MIREQNNNNLKYLNEIKQEMAYYMKEVKELTEQIKKISGKELEEKEVLQLLYKKEYNKNLGIAQDRNRLINNMARLGMRLAKSGREKNQELKRLQVLLKDPSIC
ncbi:hypothetical protein RF11_02539 [Thelohanellus kitauei]|uniref:Uncharacterized protein n=1 Tax=Thelohanellus kitauei TaxID=669202 RepID=A0A0C2J4Y7_THEKT|nr:hypothetical protein RF11_02539 [Thelohanellus kitauei]